MPSPVLALAPTVHSVVMVPLNDSAIVGAARNHTGQDRRGERINCGSRIPPRGSHADVYPGHDAGSDEDPGEGGVEFDRHSGVLQPDPQRPSQGIDPPTRFLPVAFAHIVQAPTFADIITDDV